MRADRDFAQRGPGTMLTAGVDGGGALRADGKFRLVRIVEENLYGVLTLGDVGIRYGKQSCLPLPQFGNLVARQILSHPVATPDAVDLACEYLAGIEVERPRPADRAARI